MGPLHGVRIIELAGIGPGPFAGMMLADMGADVVCVERPGGNPAAASGHRVLFRNRRAIAVDLKHADGPEVVLRLCEGADALIEGFRPGVTERLGVGPEACARRNPALVYGRMTGWGQNGPLAHAAGHDINYIALAGALHAVGSRGGPPVPPLNLLGDFGGGGMLLAFGVVCGIFEARASGVGRVVDAAMIDGVGALMAMFHGLRAEGRFGSERGADELSGGAHYYNVYETADGRWISLGPLEPAFYAELCERLGLEDELREQQGDRERWPLFAERVAAAVRRHTRDELDALLGGTDVCYAPVLELGELAEHPHHVARSALVLVNRELQPAPAPRFAGWAPARPRPSVAAGTDTRDVLASADLTAAEISALLAGGVVAEPFPATTS